MKILSFEEVKNEGAMEVLNKIDKRIKEIDNDDSLDYISEIIKKLKELRAQYK